MARRKKAKRPQTPAKLLQTAIKELGIKVPIRSYTLLPDGAIKLFTRDGAHTWSPPAPAAPPQKEYNPPQQPDTPPPPVRIRKAAPRKGK